MQNLLTSFETNDAYQECHYAVWCHKGDICISNKVEYHKKEESFKNSTKEVT
jgi:hypothetical protein